jgi:hypothetical protein
MNKASTVWPMNIWGNFFVVAVLMVVKYTNVF